MYIRVGIKGSWFVNHRSISWSHKQKIFKTSIFQESFFPKYNNFKNNQHRDMSVYLSRVKQMRLIDERKKFRLGLF